MACSAVAVLIASRLNRGYIQTLERSLLERAVELDLSDVRRRHDADDRDEDAEPPAARDRAG